MKESYKLFLLFYMAMINTGAYSQNILQASCNGLRHDDILHKQNIGIDTKDIGGDSFVLDLSNAELDDKRIAQSIQPVALSDTVYSLESGNRTYFLQRNDSVLLTRYENNLEYADYDMPEVRFKFPMGKGDAVSGHFHGLGMYCDKVAMRRFGSYVTKAESSGNVILPDGTVLSNCLCLHTVRNVAFITYSADSIHAALPVFNADSIINHLASFPSQRREEAYLIYAIGYRYPIIEVCDIYDGTTRLSHTAYYNSPDGQAMLYDRENENIRTAVAGNSNNEGTNNSQDAGTPKYHVSQDTGTQTLSITMGNSSGATVTADLIICDIQGTVYKRHSVTFTSGEHKTTELSYSGLRRGEYALHIFCSDGNDYSEKFIVR